MTMHRKGINHIDFAMAMSVMVLVIAFSIFYVTGYFSRASPADKTSELQSAAAGLGKILFESPGIPQNWENSNYTPVRAGLRADFKRVAITAAERGGANHSFEEADLHIAFDSSCLNTTYNNSIRVYGRFMNETNFRIYNSTECAANSGFLREANINFLFNITGNASQIFWLYYTNNTATPKKSAYNFSYDPSLAGYWKFDSVNASNYTFDSSANHNDGKLYNGSTSCFNLTGCINLTAGQIFSGMQFDGVNDYVDIGKGSLNMSLANGFTLSGWIFPNRTITSFQGIVSNSWQNGNRPWTIYAGNSNQLIFELNNTHQAVSGYGIITPNIWNYITAVYNTTHMIIYENGMVVGTPLAFSGNILAMNANDKVAIGATFNPTSNPFNGTIDEVRIYNRSLSAEEIKALYNFTRPNYVVSSSSVPAVADKKISALQNLSYADVKSSFDFKKNFNITACEYGFGRHIPDTVNVISSTYPVMIINSSGSVKPCLASVNVW